MNTVQKIYFTFILLKKKELNRSYPQKINKKNTYCLRLRPRSLQALWLSLSFWTFYSIVVYCYCKSWPLETVEHTSKVGNYKVYTVLSLLLVYTIKIHWCTKISSEWVWKARVILRFNVESPPWRLFQGARSSCSFMAKNSTSSQVTELHQKARSRLDYAQFSEHWTDDGRI